MAKRKRARKAKGRREPYPLSSEDSALLERLLDHPARIDPHAIRDTLPGPDSARVLLERMPPASPFGRPAPWKSLDPLSRQAPSFKGSRNAPFGSFWEDRTRMGTFRILEKTGAKDQNRPAGSSFLEIG